MVGLTLKFDVWARQGDSEVGAFRIYLGSERFARGVVTLPWEMSTSVLNSAWAYPGQEKARAALREAVLRLAVQRLDAALAQKEISKNEIVDVRMTWDDVPALEKLATEKTCSYQSWQARDLYCTAASERDETAVGSIGARRIAPTSRPVCKACNLPDTDYICSHLLHPQIGGLRAGPMYERQITVLPLCDLGRPEIESPTACRAGGNPCWEHVIEAESPGAIAVAPRALPDAIDHLDAVWRLALSKGPLLRLKRATDVAGLAQSCSTADEFEGRLSDLAEVLKALQVDDALLPGTKIPKEQSFNRLTAVIEERLSGTEKDKALQAIKTLRAVADLRDAAQHAHAADRLPTGLSKLGLRFPITDYGETWDQVRAKTIDAFAAIREAVDTLT
ncbi:MAG: hypothetical protein QOH92_576 [Chloroflexota bacterium]|jgi:hypothetical protein|nr:hypothetical protein [Chloroflexota bacterium]